MTIQKAFASYSSSQDQAEYMSLSEGDAFIAHGRDTNLPEGAT